MKKELYSVRVVPIKTPDKTDEQGNVVKGTLSYIQKSSPNEKARNANYKAEEFLQLQLFKKNDENPLDCDLKPFTYNVFKNTNVVLFETIEGLIEQEAYDVLSQASGVILLRNKIPGLVRRMNCPPYHPTQVNKTTGISEVLKANKKDPRTGDYNPEPVVMKYVEYFIPSSLVTEDDEAFARNEQMIADSEIERAMLFPAKVIASTPEEVVNAGETPVKEITPPVAEEPVKQAQ